MSKSVTVRVRTTEPNRQVGFGVNPSTQYHNVTIEPWKGYAELIVYPYVDGVDETGTDQLRADIESISGTRYVEGRPNDINVEINDPPSGSTFVGISPVSQTVAEGATANVTLTRSGDISSGVTVKLRYDDPHELLRGNHWDAPPVFVTEIPVPANRASLTIGIPVPDDQRDVDGQSFTLVVLPSDDYLLSNSGIGGASVTVSVTDNDEAQLLSFKWGWVSYTDPSWDAGEPWRTCDANGCTPGPAEGVFYYEDGRTFDFSNELEHPWPAHFQVTRRAQDTGQTATFTVRVEHDRGWVSPRHADWPVDPETGKHYKEFPLTLTVNQRTVVGRIELLDNARPRSWDFSARILHITNAETKLEVSADQEAQYWAVQGQREKSHRVTDPPSLEIKLKAPVPATVPEGDQVEFRINCLRGYAFAPLTIQIRTWEPNHLRPDGTNPTKQIHTVVFPALPMTSEFVDSRNINQTLSFSITITQDTFYEASDVLKAEILPLEEALNEFRRRASAAIEDDDQPTITLSADSTSITEGEAVTFSLTRGTNTAEELIVGVTVDDPGGFLEGNSVSEAVAVPSNVIFAAGETTKEVTITPPDDWRDIPDSALTFTAMDEPEFEILGAASLTVQVADNDVAPQVQLSFNHAEVDEGDDLVLSIIRIGEDKNPLEIPFTAGPVGNQEYIVTGMDAGQSLLNLTYRQPDDNFKGPDHHYEATLNPESPEFWTATGATTVTGAILDNDPYVVSVEALRDSVDEGLLIYYRLSHNGHTGNSLRVRVNHAETGNAVYDGSLGNETHTIPAGSSSVTPALLTHGNDGDDGDAEFTVQLIADDAYEIDDANSSATVIVKDKDPLPVLGFRDVGTRVNESVGTVDIWVDMFTPLPSLRTVTVDYNVRDTYSGNGLNITESTGTLTFAPGATSATIPVEVLQNSTAENSEVFVVILTNPVHATLQDGEDSLTHRGVIEDDEPEVSLEAQAETVDEGSDVVLELTRTGDTTNELTVWVQIDKTAPQALNRRDTVVFPAGDAAVEHTITTTDDQSRQGSHTVTATLLDPATIGEPRTYWRLTPYSDTVTVRETNLETVILLTSTLRVAEGESIGLELTRSGRSPLTVTLEVTETGEYTTGALPETVTFGLQAGIASPSRSRPRTTLLPRTPAS